MEEETVGLLNSVIIPTAFICQRRSKAKVFQSQSWDTQQRRGAAAKRPPFRPRRFIDATVGSPVMPTARALRTSMLVWTLGRTKDTKGRRSPVKQAHN